MEEILPENVPVEVVEHRSGRTELEWPGMRHVYDEIGRMSTVSVMIPEQVSSGGGL